MQYMFVTLDVSKLSDWLNADARCRESKGGRTMRGEGVAREARRRRAIAVHAVCGVELDCRFGAGHGEERTPNMKCMFVTLEVLKLSGWLTSSALCRE